MTHELHCASCLHADLERLTQCDRRRTDILCEYRRWLDANGIPAEVDGWPSPEAYNQQNVNAFVEDWRAREAIGG